jgi:CBS domain-containing protein
MTQRIRDVMTSNPCTIDAEKSVAYAAKMMQKEDVGLAPIVEGDRLVGMLTDRDIAVRVAAQGRDPGQVKVLEVASKKLVTIDPQQDLDEALRIMAQHQVRRLPVVEEDGRLIGVVAQADIAREGDDATTGQLVQEISDSGGQMSSIEEQGFGVQPQFEAAVPEPVIETQEEEEVSRVQAASARPRRRSTRKRTTTARKRSTSKRSTSGRKKTTSRKKSTTSRKKSTASRKRSTTKKRSTAKRSTAKKKTTSRKRSTAKRGTAKRKTTSRKRSTAKRGTAKRKTTSRKRSTTKKRSTAKRGTAKRKTTSRKRSTAAKRGAAKRKTTTRKRAAAGRKGGRKTARKRSMTKRSTAKRSTAKRRTTRRRTSR